MSNGYGGDLKHFFSRKPAQIYPSTVEPGVLASEIFRDFFTYYSGGEINGWRSSRCYVFSQRKEWLKSLKYLEDSGLSWRMRILVLKPTKSCRSSVAAIGPHVCNSSGYPLCCCQDLRSLLLSTAPQWFDFAIRSIDDDDGDLLILLPLSRSLVGPLLFDWLVSSLQAIGWTSSFDRGVLFDVTLCADVIERYLFSRLGACTFSS